jgi:hypothetical protein
LVRERLGTPTGSSRQTTANLHVEGQIDTVVYWRFQDLEFYFLVAGSEDFLFETRARAQYAPVATLAARLQSLQDAREFFGPPSWTQQPADTIVLGYAVPRDDPGGEDMIKLYYVRSRLVAVGAAPYVD